MDGKVIDGHVIPRKVLFTTPTPKDHMFETLANGDNMKVFISFSQEQEGRSKNSKLLQNWQVSGKIVELLPVYVKSHTLVEDGNHTKGVVIAVIKEPNIPVKNGVVHLIHKPLMVVDHTVKQFLEVSFEV